MPIKVKLPLGYMRFAGGREWVEVIGSDGNLAEVCRILEQQIPGLRGRFLEPRTPEPAVRRGIRVFLNGTDIRKLSKLSTPVKDGDEVMIVAAISGG